MTRLPSIIDPGSRAPARVRVPSSQLAIPALGNVNFGPVAPSQAGAIGAAVANVAGRLGETLRRREQKMKRAVQARQLTEFKTKGLTAVSLAQEAAAEANPEHAEATYFNRTQELELEISQIEDEELRAEAMVDFDNIVQRGAISVRRNSVVKQAGMQRAAVREHAAQMIEAVELGRVDRESALIEHEEQLDLNSEAYSAEQLVAERLRFKAAIDQGHDKLIQGQLAQVTVLALDAYERAGTDDLRLDIEDRITEAVQDAIALGSITVEQGVAIREAFKRSAEARIKAKISRISQRATSRFNAGDGLGIEGLVEDAKSLPESPDKTVLLDELDSKLTRLNQSKGTGQKILGILYEGARGEVPQDNLGLDQAFRAVMAANGDLAEHARRLTDRGSRLGPAFQAHIRSLTAEGTKDLPELVRIYGFAGRRRARDLASGSSNPDLAFASMAATGSELDMLSDTRVPGQLKIAELHLNGDNLVKRKIEPLDRQVAIKAAFKQDVTLNTDQLEAFEARYFIRFAEFRVSLGDAGNDEEVANKAAARAAEDIARDFEPIGNVLIRKSLIDDLDMDRLLRATDLNQRPFFIQRGIVFGRKTDEPPRLDLLFRAGEKVYIPFVGEAGPTEFIEINPLNYELRRIRPGTDDFNMLDNRLRSDTAPVDFDPFSNLQWREEYGATAIDEYDKQFGTNLGGALYTRMRLNLEELGLLEGLDEQQQKDMVEKFAQNKAREIGWENVFKPGGLGE